MGNFKTSFYFPIRTQARIVTPCALLHNLILKHMPTSLEVDKDSDDSDSDSDSDDEGDDNDDEVEYIIFVQPSNV